MGGAARKGNTMTPDQARSEIMTLQQNPSFMKQYNESGPGHADAVAQMQRLHDAAYPELAE